MVIAEILGAAAESSSRMASLKDIRVAAVVSSSNVALSGNIIRSSSLMMSRMTVRIVSVTGICSREGSEGNLVEVVAGILALLVSLRRRHASMMLSTVRESRAMRYWNPSSDIPLSIWPALSASDMVGLASLQRASTSSM